MSVKQTSWLRGGIEELSGFLDKYSRLRSPIQYQRCATDNAETPTRPRQSRPHMDNVTSTKLHAANLQPIIPYQNTPDTARNEAIQQVLRYYRLICSDIPFFQTPHCPRAPHLVLLYRTSGKSCHLGQHIITGLQCSESTKSKCSIIANMNSDRSTPGQASSGAAGLLKRQLKYMQTAKDLPGISCGLVDDNVFEWEVMLMISDDCKYYGGSFINPLTQYSSLSQSQKKPG
jgi:hypothetical protein